MTISDKTRKLLWAQSGNRCALCGRTLTQRASGPDPSAVVGDECHIVSAALGGPRYDPHVDGDLDGYENLLLLCASDHRLVDAHVGTYSADKLKQLKANHECAIAEALDLHIARSEASRAVEVGHDNYRTEISFVAGQAEQELEAFQQCLIRDRRLRAYGKVATGFNGPSHARRFAWIQSFLPVSAELARTLAREIGVQISGVHHHRLPGVYRGLIPD